MTTNATLAALTALTAAHRDLDATAGDLHTKRVQLIATARSEGIQASQIAQAAGISRARLYQILKGTS